MARGSSVMMIGRQGLPSMTARSSFLNLPSTHTTPSERVPPMLLNLPPWRAFTADWELALNKMLSALSLSVMEGEARMELLPISLPLMNLASVPTALQSDVVEVSMLTTVDCRCGGRVEGEALALTEPTKEGTDLISEEGTGASTLVDRGQSSLGR